MNIKNLKVISMDDRGETDPENLVLISTDDRFPSYDYTWNVKVEGVYIEITPMVKIDGVFVEGQFKYF